MIQGTVVRDLGNQLIVDVGGEEIPCVIRKTLRRRAGKWRKAVVVGDRVTVEASGEGHAIIAVENRRTVLSRQDPSQSRREQILVSNVDAVLIVASVRQPDLSTALIDRFLVAVESRGLEAGIALNKIDLDAERSYAPFADAYRALDYPVMEVSADEGIGLDDVRAFLKDKTTTMLGHSGVGKSSLANALDPSLELRIGDVQESSGKGMHTTTHVSLLRLPWGGYLVDTPGIREFALWDMDAHDAGVWFRDVADYAGGCKFNDCLHGREPDCAVKHAVETGDIPEWRYESYLRLLESLQEE